MGGGSSQPTTQYVKSETSSLPEYAKPYFMDLMEGAKAYTLGNTDGYQTYPGQRVAGFTGQQQQIQNDIMGQQTPGQFGAAAQLGQAAGLGSLYAGQYNPSQFSAQAVHSAPLMNYQMQGAQSNYGNGIQALSMGMPGQWGQPQANQYMSPYAQSVMDVQKREAVTDAKKSQLAEDLGAARQGTYGGSRQLLASMERERNLGNQLGDIQAKGQQSAYENAQQQYNADRNAGLTAGQANLNAGLQAQQLGGQFGLQNLSNEQQARTQNLNALLQTQQQRAANSLQAQQLNQSAGLEAQKLGEQSSQFGASLGLQGLAQANQSAQTLGNLGQMQGQADMSRLNQQQQTAAQQQALQQQYLDTQYQDFLRQQNYPLDMLQQYSSLLRGVPVSANTTQTTSAPAPSLASQIMGTGLGALGMYKALAG